MPHLANFRCHLIDLPGAGASITPASTKLSVRGHIDALLAVIEELGLERFALVRHDSGGLIARFVAAQLGDHVTALIVTGTEIPQHFPPLISRLKLAARLPGAATVFRKLLARPRLARSNQVLGGSFWDRDLLEGDFRTLFTATAFGTNQVIRRNNGPHVHPVGGNMPSRTLCRSRRSHLPVGRFQCWTVHRPLVGEVADYVGRSLALTQ